jgi:hypothetical protein
MPAAAYDVVRVVADLFDDLTIGAVTAPNRVLMAPLTRRRMWPNTLRSRSYAFFSSAKRCIVSFNAISAENAGPAFGGGRRGGRCANSIVETSVTTRTTNILRMPVGRIAARKVSDSIAPA